MSKLHKHMTKSFSMMMSFLLIFSMLVPTVQAGGVEEEEGSNYIEGELVDVDATESQDSKPIVGESTTEIETEAITKEEEDTFADSNPGKYALFEEREEIPVKVRIEGLGETIVPLKEFNLAPYDITHAVGDNQVGKWHGNNNQPLAIHAIVKAMELHGFDVSDDDVLRLPEMYAGNYIDKVAGLETFSTSSTDGWMYTVNNEYTSLGVGQHELQENDEIVLYFTTDFTTTAYSWFDRELDEINVGEEIQLELTGSSFGSIQPIDNAVILVNDKPHAIDGQEVVTDAQGVATLRFDNPGEYHISAQRIEGEYSNIIRPYSKVIVLGDDAGETEPPSPAPQLSVASTIDGGTVNPSVIVTLTGDKFSVDVTDNANWDLQANATNLEIEKITRDNDQQVTISFNGKAQEGTLSITALAGALEGSEESKEVLVEVSKDENVPGNEEALDKMIENTVQYYKTNNTSLSSWWKIVALWGAGENLTDGSWTLPTWQTIDPKLKPDAGDTEHIRYIFGLLAMGKDPSKAWETNRNLYAELAAQQKENGSIGGMNKHVWAMLALDAGEKLGHNVGTWDKGNKQQALKYVLDLQKNDGGFALFGTESDTDITGMVLLALGNYQGDSAVDNAIEKAKEYLKHRQLDLTNGGFNSAGSWGMGDNSNSLSTSVSGLVAVNEDILAEKWTVNGKTVVDAYKGFQLENGGFKWKHADPGVNGVATEQALIALTDIQIGKSVWQRLAEQDLIEPGPDGNQETVVEPDQPFVLPMDPNEDVSVPVVLDFKKITNNKLPSITANRAGVMLEIPSNTSVTSSWDKKIQVPTKEETTPEDKANITKALVGKQLVDVAVHIKIGGSQPIVFDRHVSLTFANLGTKEAGFVDVDGNFTSISKEKDPQKDVYAYQDGDDLVIKTKHFTEFLAFETVTNPTNDLTVAVQSAIKDVSEKLVRDGVASEWEAIGLAKAGVQVPVGYMGHFKKTLEDQVLKQTGKGKMKITDVERLAIAATAIGIDPKNVDGKGFNLIEKIYNSEARIMGAESVDSLTFQGNNGILFALIALDSKAYEVPENAKWTRDKLVAELLKNQKADGSWGLSTSSTAASNVDITAMALTALAPYQTKSNVKAAVDKAAAFLSQAQGATGGYSDAFVGGISSESTSQVIIGLTANNIDPRGEKFTENGINLIDHLLSFKANDGGFKHIVTDASSNAMATEQALQALVAFDLYVNGKGPLYKFAGGESTDPNPTPDPGEKPDPKPEEKPDPKPEEKPDPVPTTKNVHLSVEKRTMGQGDIVSPMQAVLHEGDTAYTLLQRIADERGVSVQSIGSGPTLYVQAIDGLGEFDGGPLSGWMYSVNGDFPMFSAGIYTLQEGDVLRWQYTRDLGKDLGNIWNPEEDKNKPLPPKENDVKVPSDRTFTLAVQPNEDVSIPVVMEFTTTVLPNVIANRAGARLEIPANTTVTSNWNKKIQAPTQMETTAADKVKIRQAFEGNQLLGIDAHIKVGGSQTITFDRHVSLTFRNLGNRASGFMDVNGNFIRIDKKDSANEKDDVFAYQDGNDLVIKTKHFTEFLVFEVTDKPSDESLGTVQSAIKAISSKVLRDGVQTEWEAIGLAKAGVQVPASYVTQFKKNVYEQVISKSGTGRMKITDVERLAMAATAIGIDPTNVDGKGFNLIKKIYNSEDRKMGTESVDSLTFQGNNGIIFALIALDSKAYEVPENAKWTREKLVAELVKTQKADGAWSLETSTTGATSIDITAMALIALATYKDQVNVKTAIDKAVVFLAKEQGPTGGFNESFVGGITSEAASQVIIALTANGIDPRSKQFTKNGITLLDHLLGFKAEDGGFKHITEDKTSNSMATEQALQALVAVELYLKGEGALYQFTGQQLELKPELKPVPKPIQFTDISSHWAKDYIEKAVQAGLVNGYEDGTFRPSNQLTRAQVVAIIVRALELKTTDKAPFKDIANYAEETRAEIAAAYKYGIVKGSNGNFNPSQKVTRAQMALMMQRALEYQLGEKYVVSKKAPFTDFGQYNKEAVDAISMLYDTGITTGDNGKYMPGNPTSRAHATKMLVNFIELQQAN